MYGSTDMEKKVGDKVRRLKTRRNDLEADYGLSKKVLTEK